jgi:hypothetical protein
MAVQLFEGQAYAFGGCPASSNYKAERYSITNNTWTEIADLPKGIRNGSSAEYLGSIYLSNFEGQIMVYEPKSNFYSVTELSVSSGGHIVQIAYQDRLEIFRSRNDVLH